MKTLLLCITLIMPACAVPPSTSTSAERHAYRDKVEHKRLERLQTKALRKQLAK